MKLELDIPQIPEPSIEVRGLLYLVLEAHAGSARENDCVSSAAVRNCNAGNPGTLSGIASAILTVGKVHAPVYEARQLWKWWGAKYEGKVPGFGNSFFPDGDHKWFPVREWIMRNFKEIYQKLCDIESEMLKKSDTLHANAAMYTAICCELLAVPVGQEGLLFILPRLPVWFTL